MTQPTPPPTGTMYGQPATPERPAQPKRRARKWLVGIGAATFVLCGAGAIATALSIDVDTTPPGSVDRDVDAGGDTADRPAPAQPVYDDPEPADFSLAVKVLSKQCFGSAGCNVEFRIELTQENPDKFFDPDATYEITYEVKGGDDPYINTLTVQGGTYQVQETEFISTPSGDSELRAEIVEISEY